MKLRKHVCHIFQIFLCKADFTFQAGNDRLFQDVTYYEDKLYGTRFQLNTIGFCD